MERLTKDKRTMCIVEDNQNKNYFNQIHDKLSKLEDLEDELGIPLEVLFKALKDGIWTNGYEKRDGRKIWLRNYDGKVILEVSNRFCFDVYYPKDYGVAWALTKEELE